MSFRYLLWKDMRLEARSKESLQAGLVLVGLFFILYLFSLSDLADPRLATVAVWTPIIYATAALSSRGLTAEFDRGTIVLLQTLPLPAAMTGWSRTLINAVLASLLAALSLLLANIGFGMPLTPPLWLITGLAVIGLALVGTLAGALASQARAPAILAPILLIPAAAPLLQSGVRATLSVLEGTSPRSAMLLMVGYDLIMGGVAWFLWPFALESD